MRGKGEKMNMSTTKRYQDILQELSKTPREDVVKFRNKYEEALNEFLELKEVYTIASKKSSLEEIKNNTAKPLCALNHKKLPTIWFFSEREFAKDFVNHFRLIKDEVEYIRVLKGEEKIEAIKYSTLNLTKSKKMFYIHDPNCIHKQINTSPSNGIIKIVPMIILFTIDIHLI